MSIELESNFIMYLEKHGYEFLFLDVNLNHIYFTDKYKNTFIYVYLNSNSSKELILNSIRILRMKSADYNASIGLILYNKIKQNFDFQAIRYEYNYHEIKYEQFPNKN